MSEKAARKALSQAKVAPQDIDLIVYAGILYDYLCPPSSVLVQEALGIPYCAEMSIHSNCTAIYKAIQVAADLISNGRYNKALVVTSQISSVFLRAEYLNQKALTLEQVILRWFLSDGAGALVMSHKKGSDLTLQVTDTYLESVGLGIEPSMKMGVGVANSNPLEIYEHGYHHLVQDIKTVSEVAPRFFKQGFDQMLEKTGLKLQEVKCFFANVPTKHMMDELSFRLRKDFDYPDLPFYTKLATRGYQGAPAAIIALDDYLRETPMLPGDRWVSFVTESSKWMHAGFILDCC
jgi:3-oxoacyl-[acyl-carrier-protein] synthase III